MADVVSRIHTLSSEVDTYIVPSNSSVLDRTPDPAGAEALADGYELLESEIEWRDRYTFLESRGYVLRSRYRPSWRMSWLGTSRRPAECEDSIMSRVCVCHDLQFFVELTIVLE